jgi:hypothetical protein
LRLALLEYLGHCFDSNDTHIGGVVRPPQGAEESVGAELAGHPLGRRLFVRQPLTRAGASDQQVTQDVLDLLRTDEHFSHINVITGYTAHEAGTFRANFERATGQVFAPTAFRSYRLGLLATADAMLVIRTSLSESGAFEVAYNAATRRIPILFALHPAAPLTTTLLQDLQELCPTTYVPFMRVEELVQPLHRFLTQPLLTTGETGRTSHEYV